MGYGDTDPVAQKTGRIALLCGTLCVLGLFVFLFKVEACSSKPEDCRDEFVEIKGDYQSTHKCTNGATVEVVNSPPAPKPGILCHCPKNSGAPSAPPPASAK
jgi:hypothetical protein